MVHAIVVSSPNAGRAKLLEAALSSLEQHGLHIIRVISINELDMQQPQGQSWKDEGAGIVIVAGGDGTVGSTIEHIVGTDLTLGILPLGTANDIARTLSIPQEIEQATEIIANGQTTTIDIGMIQAGPHSRQPQEFSAPHTPKPIARPSFFAHALAIGLNVEFARLATNITTRQRFGKLAYPVAALEVMKNPRLIDLELSIKGLALPTSQGTTPTIRHTPSITPKTITFACSLWQATIINAPFFGGAVGAFIA